ncbi:MAG: hypothetical protein HFG53_14285 [Lachnospiraceae bacterium]|jgi:hypothetical protein|nr:hypothetical protein [Lachnospiraceae bacterium]
MEYYQKSAYRSNKKYKQKSSGGLPDLLLFYILPFIVFNSILFYCVASSPKINLEIQDTKDYLSTQASMTIESWFPTKSISFNMDGEELEPVKDKRRTYSVPITRNGVLEVTVVNLNGMSSTVFKHVNVLDDIPPSFENATLEDGILMLRVTDSQSLVNSDAIYAVDSAGIQHAPLSVERIEDTIDNTTAYSITFEMDLNGLHVYVQDKAGNEAQKTFTTHKEGNLDVLEVGPEEDQTDQGNAAPDALPAENQETEPASEESSAASSSGSSDVSIVIE